MASDLGADGSLCVLWSSQYHGYFPFWSSSLSAYELRLSAKLVHRTEPSSICVWCLHWTVLPNQMEVQEAQNGNEQPRLLKLRSQCKEESYQIGNDRLDK
jgi:hypothetical protein